MSKALKSLTHRELRILLTFLVDSNEQTVELARQQLRSAVENQPALRAAIDAVPEQQLRHEAQLVVEQVELDRVRLAFRRVVRAPGDADLEAGLALLARFVYPDLPPDAIRVPLDTMAEEIDRRISKELALPTRPINGMRRYLFEEEGFHGDKRTPSDPRNHLLNDVLARRTGSPLLLSAVYLLLAKRLNLLVHGIGLPGHFIVGHRVPRGVVFIDPHQNGRVLRKKDCEVLVRRLGYTFREEHLDPVSNRDILARALAQMINVYSEQGATAKAKALSKLYRLIPDAGQKEQ